MTMGKTRSPNNTLTHTYLLPSSQSEGEGDASSDDEVLAGAVEFRMQGNEEQLKKIEQLDKQNRELQARRIRLAKQKQKLKAELEKEEELAATKAGLVDKDK